MGKRMRHLALCGNAAMGEQGVIDNALPASRQGIDARDRAALDVPTQSAAKLALQNRLDRVDDGRAQRRKPVCHLNQALVTLPRPAQLQFGQDDALT